jgi:CRP/FNR family transcriptional regulator, cyclic AMP receptor protein
MNPDAGLDACEGGADPWLRSVPPALAQWLLGHARPVALRAGQRLFARGDAPDGLYGITAGQMRFTGVTNGGQEAILAICEAPQWFGEIALFDNAPRTHDAWAQTDATLRHVPQHALDELLAAQPAHWRHFGRLLTHKLRVSFVAMEDLVLLPPTPRVAGRLALMATGHGALEGGGGPRLLKVSQEQLAQMLALSRQTVNQALKELEAAGAIRRSRAAIEVLDLQALQRGG